LRRAAGIKRCATEDLKAARIVARDEAGVKDGFFLGIGSAVASESTPVLV
jgi:hypothetical protein